MSLHGRMFAAGREVWKNKIKHIQQPIQPNKPNDPAKEGDEEQKWLALFVLLREGLPHLSTLLSSRCNAYTAVVLFNYSS